MGIKIDKNRIPDSVPAAKDIWRREIRKAMSGIDSEYMRSASEAIKDRLMGMDEYRSASVVMAYCSFGREVDTYPLIHAMLADGKKICLPRCTDIGIDGTRVPGTQGMEARYVTDLDKLSSGAYGIDEPPERDDFPVAYPGDIDLVILPCLACDVKCNRIGHGAGYYDKYLSLLKPETVNIALCYEAVLADELPIEEHDKPVDAVITEDTVYRWRGQQINTH